MVICYVTVRAVNKNEASTYQSYLVRLWRDSENSPWLASPQSRATGQIYPFADVLQIWGFLMTQIGGDADDLAAIDRPSHQAHVLRRSQQYMGHLWIFIAMIWP